MSVVCPSSISFLRHFGLLYYVFSIVASRCAFLHVVVVAFPTTNLARTITITATATTHCSSTRRTLQPWHTALVVSTRRKRLFTFTQFSSSLLLSTVKCDSTTSSSSDITGDPPSADSDTRTTTPTLHYGLLLSSFQQGLQSSLAARRFLRNSLTECLLLHEQKKLEHQLSQSAASQGPCCGPDVSILTRLEQVDEQVQLLHQQQQSSSSLVLVDNDSEDDDTVWQSSLQLILNNHPELESSSKRRIPIQLRFVYIPTAMYAARRDSNNTPGKQRQRARADGKQRRDEIVQLLHEIFTPTTTRRYNHKEQVSRSATTSSCSSLVEIHAVTVDWDDASVKQAEISESANTASKPGPPPISMSKMTSTNNHKKNSGQQQLHHADFPTSGMQALSCDDWNPHFIYVDGGNTFWLYHCMEKNSDKYNWKRLLTQQITSSSSSQPSSSSSCSNVPAVYCGNSAGAIIMGAFMETACWKKWDDPSIVPSPNSSSSSTGADTNPISISSSSSSSYDDWKGIQGLNLLKGISVFPHYNQEMWGGVVQIGERNLQEIASAVPVGGEHYFDSTLSTVQCIRDEDVLCVQNGKLQRVTSDTNVVEVSCK